MVRLYVFSSVKDCIPLHSENISFPLIWAEEMVVPSQRKKETSRSQSLRLISPSPM